MGKHEEVVYLIYVPGLLIANNGVEHTTYVCSQEEAEEVIGVVAMKRLGELACETQLPLGAVAWVVEALLKEIRAPE